MWASVISLSTIVAFAAGAIVPRIAATTVTVTASCDSGAATILPTQMTSTQSLTVSSTPLSVTSDTYSGGNVKLGPVSNPNCDPTHLSNITPKSNLTLFYGSNDISTPDCNAQISVQMRMLSVILEDIFSVHSVVCSEGLVTIIFKNADGYKTSRTEWPASGDLILFTNHLGNCDAELERGIFLVSGLAFDESTLTVVATAEKSGFQSTAGSMQIDFGQVLGLTPPNSSNSTNSTTGSYRNTTAISKRDITWDPTYSLSFDTALPTNTTIASIDPYISVIANTASFRSSATFSGHFDYNFWQLKVEQLYFDLDVAFDATLDLTSSIQAGISHSFSYSPASLAIAPISIPGILTLGPALDFSIGAQLGATADVHIITQTEVALRDGNVHVDLLQEANTSVSGWTPHTAASTSLDVDAAVQINPYVELGVELAVQFLGGLVGLSSGISANATLVNQLSANGVVEASAAASLGNFTTSVGVPTGTVNGVCQNGLEYKSDFIFGITGFVAQFYSKKIYGVEVPIFDRCWGIGQF